MRRRTTLAALFTVPAAIGLAFALSSSGRAHEGRRDGGDDDKNRFKHIFYIMMENHGTDEIIGNRDDAPYINSLADKYAVFTNYYGVTHPSLPNYLAAISGDFQGIWDDCKAGADVFCAPEEFVADSGDPTSSLLLTPAEVASATSTAHWFDGQNIVDQIEDSGRTWKAYMQSLPSTGSDVEYAPTDIVNGQPVARKLYAQKHNPFMYFSDIRNDKSRLKRIVPFSHFSDDLGRDDGEKVPNFVWISPDQCHDMHGVSPTNAVAVGLPSCGYPDAGLDHGAIQLGDEFLKHTVEKIMKSRAWDEGSAIVIAWDEDDYAGYAGCCQSPTTDGNQILGGARAPAIVITSKGAKHEVSDAPFNHYSLLGTIQKLWDLDCLANTCSFGPADLMTRFFGK